MRTVLLPLVAALLATGCDVISPPYTEESPADTGTAGAFVQKVLLEDYTGFRCGNCPEAHERAQELQARYPGRVILMSVHAGFFARPAAPPYTYDFRNPVATELDEFFGISRAGNPNGMVNRRGYPGNHILAPTAWAGAVAEALQGNAPVALSLEARLDTGRWELTITARVRYRERGTPNDYLALYVVEDSIVQYQLDYRRTPPDIPNYVHRFVLRDGVMGAWGEQLHPEGVAAGDSLSRTYRYRFPREKDWRPQHCGIIGIVHRYGTTYEVVQAEYVPFVLQ